MAAKRFAADATDHKGRVILMVADAKVGRMSIYLTVAASARLRKDLRWAEIRARTHRSLK